MVEDWHVKTVDATVDAVDAEDYDLQFSVYGSGSEGRGSKVVQWFETNLGRDGAGYGRAGSRDGQRGSPLSLKVTSFLQILHGDVHF
jgi:hypothetical protein